MIKVVFRKMILGEADKKPGDFSNSLGQRGWGFRPSQPTPLGPTVMEGIRGFPPWPSNILPSISRAFLHDSPCICNQCLNIDYVPDTARCFIYIYIC